MADHSRWRLFVYRLAYVGLSLGIMIFQLLPLDHLDDRWAGPDLLLAIPFAWALRRPEYVPALSVALVLLLADLLFQRPPGLLAAFGVLAVENIKSRSAALRGQSFMVEWLHVAVLIVVILLACRIVLAVLLIPQAPLVLSLMQVLLTILVYPVVVFASGALLGIRKSALGDVIALGSRT